MSCKYCKKEVENVAEDYQNMGSHFWCSQIEMRKQLGVVL